MLGGPHIYQYIPLATAGVLVGLYLIAVHLFMLLKPELAKAQLTSLPRNYQAGVVVTIIAMVWFWLLVAPVGNGLLNKLGMDLGEFNGLKPILRLVVPVVAFLVVTQVKEFLFVRGLGLLMLMAASPILMAAFLKEPSSRLLLSLFAYAMIIKGLFWVGTPYVFRDVVSWATATAGRFKNLSIAGLAYGVLILFCAVIFWRGH